MGLRAVYEAYLQKPSQAKKSADGALKLSQMSDTIERVAVALAVSGDIKHAETLIDRFHRSDHCWRRDSMEAVPRVGKSADEACTMLITIGLRIYRNTLDTLARHELAWNCTRLSPRRMSVGQ
jgi:hypothetical protein